MYDVRLIGDSVLRKPAGRVIRFDERIAGIADEMVETMHEKDGIGLAAPQVGISLRLIVVDITPIDRNAHPRVFVNPEILETWGEISMEEGCLSIPGVTEEVSRPEGVVLKYQEITGEEKEERFEGWDARVIQHEIDHLNGILFVDYLSPLKRKLVKNKLNALI